MSWTRGRDEILALLDRGDLTQVVADRDLAHRLLDAANRHIGSAGTLCDSDPELAYAALYDAIRKALSALLRPVNRIRTTRHAVQYPDAATYIDADQVRADLPAAVAIVQAAQQAVAHLPIFQA